jgi:peptidoglycan hydrolase-like protein with peptidoglycan-binding domain
VTTYRSRILVLVIIVAIAVSGGLAQAQDKLSPFPQKRPRVTSTDLVKKAQKKLKDQGYYSGIEDGILHPETRAAIRRYQLDKGLRTDGRLNDQTAESLKLVLLAISPKPAPIP